MTRRWRCAVAAVTALALLLPATTAVARADGRAAGADTGVTGGVVSGRVTGPDGAPVATTVRLTRVDRAGQDETTSGADGTFVFSGLAPGDYKLTVRSSGELAGRAWPAGNTLFDATARTIRVGASTSVTDVAVRLTASTRPVVVRLLGPDDEPLVGAQVSMTSFLGLDPPRTFVTGPDGTARLEAVTSGAFRFEMASPPPGYNALRASGWVTPAPGEEVTVRATPISQGSIWGHVVGDRSGLPLLALVHVTDDEGTEVAEAGTLDGGEFEISLDPGSYRLSFEGSGFQVFPEQFWPGVADASDARVVTVSAGRITRIDGALRENRGGLTGVLLDQDGVPMEGELISLRALGDILEGHEPAVTGEDGRFHFDRLRPGAYEVRPYDSRADQATRAVRATVDTTTYDIGEVRIWPAASIEGSVAPGSQAALAVAVDPASGLWVSSTAVGDDGRFRLVALPPGSFGVRVLPPWSGSTQAPTYWDSAATIAEARLVELGVGDRASVGPIVMQPAATITGDVTDQHGDVLAGVDLTITEVGDPNYTYGQDRTSTDGRGHFVFDNLSAGQYVVRYYCNNEIIDPFHNGLDEDLAAVRVVSVETGGSAVSDATYEVAPTSDFTARRSCVVSTREQPRIVGRSRVGGELRLHTSRVRPASARVHVAWLVSGKPVSRGAAFAVRRGHVGKQVRALVTITRPGYRSLKVLTKARRIGRTAA